MIDEVKEKKKPGPKPKPAVAETVLVRCVCSNVHLGNGLILRATQNTKGNWKDGDTAEVSVALASLLIANESCEEV